MRGKLHYKIKNLAKMEYRTHIVDSTEFKNFKEFFKACSRHEMSDIQKAISKEKETKFRIKKNAMYGELEREFPDESFKILIKNTKNIKHVYSYKIMRYMGLRIGEVINLRKCDIIENEYLKIKTLKQRKEKIDMLKIPIILKTELLNYIGILELFGEIKSEFDLIVNTTTKSIRKNFRNTTLKLGLNKIYEKSEERFKTDKKGRKRTSRTLYLYTTHSLRHRFCNWIDEKVPNRRMTQALMRHSKLSSTEVYFKSLLKEANILFQNIEI